MRRMRTLIALACLIATIALMPSAASAANRPDGTRYDLTRLVDIERYLAAQGLDASQAVVQRGPLNYAGDDCPGEAWNCTGAKFVIQLGSASSSGANAADCKATGGTPGVTSSAPDSCVIVQTAGGNVDNDARCNLESNQESAVVQTCTITQLSANGKNKAFVRMHVVQKASDAKQTADVSQTTTSGSNASDVSQTIQQVSQLQGGGTQVQDGHQLACVKQTITSTLVTSGNDSDVTQDIAQHAEAQQGAVTQTQNTTPASLNCGLGSGNHNSNALINQTSTLGPSRSGLRQGNSYSALAVNTSSTAQTQGVFGGGMFGDVDQTSTTGALTSIARQDEVQRARGPENATQHQVGEEFCCSTQTGGTAANRVEITQTKLQVANSTTQDVNIAGLCNAGAGTCAVNQSATQTDPAAVQTAFLTINCTATSGCTGTQRLDENGTVTTNSCPGGATCNITTSSGEEFLLRRAAMRTGLVARRIGFERGPPARA